MCTMMLPGVKDPLLVLCPVQTNFVHDGIVGCVSNCQDRNWLMDWSYVWLQQSENITRYVMVYQLKTFQMWCYFCVIWFDVRGCWSLSWYWWNCLPSLFKLYYTPAPRRGVYWFQSVRPKIFFVTFFSATIDDRNLIFGPTSCLPT